MYNAEQVEMMLHQFHSMTIEFLHNGQEPRYDDICKSIGYTPIEIDYDKMEHIGIDRNGETIK
jgi:hypothetical protein